MRPSWVVSGVAAAWVAGCASPVYDAPIECEACARWNAPQAPFRIAERTWYVGVAGLSAILVETGQGLVLIDAGLPQSAPLIRANIRALGFRPENIVLIFLSHAHYDHAGGIAALQRVSGARVLAGTGAQAALRAGELLPDDPQYDPGAQGSRFPAVRRVEAIGDGESVAVGDVTFTAHHTPGHTRGGVTWTWRACGDSGCHDVVYADSLSPISADAYRFSAGAGRAANSLRTSAAKIGSLPCDIFLSNHPAFFGMRGKLASDAAEPFARPGECRAYAKNSIERLERRLREEAAL